MIDDIRARQLLRTAYWLARESPDPSTQNAAFLATPDGTLLRTTAAVNEFPLGVEYTAERWERPLKYQLIEHAERNALFAAARHGIATRGLVLVCPWAACSDCARAIIQCGVAELITLRPVKGDTHERWDASVAVAMRMLDEAGVRVRYFDSPIGEGLPKIRRNGELVVL